MAKARKTASPGRSTRRTSPRRKSAGPKPRTAAKSSRGLSLVARAFEEIKEKILTLHFLPGQYLNEGALCALLGLGRTPVHQALHRLQHEGLVEIMPRKGVIVQPDSISEIVRILESRAAVEAELARSAAERGSARDAAELRALARASADGETIDDFIAQDRAFHRKFAEMAANPVLSDFARSLHERSIRYWYLHLWQTMNHKATVRQHSAIADAIARRDADGAAKALREHVDSLRGRLMRVNETAQRRIPASGDGRLGAKRINSKNGGRR
jgi:GntR family transcriptional regulator, rspAB operon transcriptional repressor